MYTYSAHPSDVHKRIDAEGLSLLSYDKAHLANTGQSLAWGRELATYLKKNARGLFKQIHVESIPFKPLLGINAPAVGFEIGLKQKDDWKSLVMPLSQAIAALASCQKS